MHLPPLRARFRDPVLREFLRYFASSALALAVDAGLLRLGRVVGLPLPWAVALGFCGGAVVAYLLSVRWVFETRSQRDWRREFLVFVSVGLLGLGLTELLMWLAVTVMGQPDLVGKAESACGVFLFNFGARKLLLFRKRAP